MLAVPLTYIHIMIYMVVLATKFAKIRVYTCTVVHPAGLLFYKGQGALSKRVQRAEGTGKTHSV